jgi:hypothetical protein
MFPNGDRTLARSAPPGAPVKKRNGVKIRPEEMTSLAEATDSAVVGLRSQHVDYQDNRTIRLEAADLVHAFHVLCRLARTGATSPGRLPTPSAWACCQTRRIRGRVWQAMSRLVWTGPCVLAAGRLLRPHPTPSLPRLGGFPRRFAFRSVCSSVCSRRVRDVASRLSCRSSGRRLFQRFLRCDGDRLFDRAGVVCTRGH